MTTLLLSGLAASAVTFTSDTTISFNNTSYDGLDVVVTNCTLTIDGPHTFASLQVLNGGAVTHLFAPNGYVNNWLSVGNLPVVLSVTNAVTTLRPRAKSWARC